MTTKRSAGKKPKAAPPSANERISDSFCFYCLERLSAKLDGSDVRHLDGTPYGECAQARKGRI